MIGNDDCGQMSAWYILSTLGFYPVNPVGGTFVLGSPQVASARLNFSNGQTFQIIAQGFSGSVTFNERRWLNGVALSHPHITYTDLIKGGSLTFEMVED